MNPGAPLDTLTTRQLLTRAATLLEEAGDHDIQTRDHFIAAQGSEKVQLAGRLRQLAEQEEDTPLQRVLDDCHNCQNIVLKARGPLEEWTAEFEYDHCRFGGRGNTPAEALVEALVDQRISDHHYAAGMDAPSLTEEELTMRLRDAYRQYFGEWPGHGYRGEYAAQPADAISPEPAPANMSAPTCRQSEHGRPLEAITARLQKVAHIRMNGGNDDLGGKYYGTVVHIGQSEAKLWHCEKPGVENVLPSTYELARGRGEKDVITVEEFFGEYYPCSSHWQSQGDADMADFLLNAREDIAALLRRLGVQAPAIVAREW